MSRGVDSNSNKIVTDMDEHASDGESMKDDAIKVAKAAFEKLKAASELSDVSLALKSFFDKKYGPTWHCVVGADFRAFVSHEAKTFIFFYHGKNAICLFKAG